MKMKLVYLRLNMYTNIVTLQLMNLIGKTRKQSLYKIICITITSHTKKDCIPS